MKKGRVVILLAGRRAGMKAVIVKQNDDGKKVSVVSNTWPVAGCVWLQYLRVVLMQVVSMFRTRNSPTLWLSELSVPLERSPAP